MVTNSFSSLRRVVEGTDVLKQMESLDCFNERPIKSCSISECGVLIVEDN